MISKDLLKGSLKSIVLRLLAENPRMYGYEITHRVEELTKGEVKLTFGALYPILHKLESEGTVITESVIINNRNRIYYKLTPQGKSIAQEKIEELREFVEMIENLLKPGMSPSLCTI